MGVPPSGPMDSRSFRLANALVGNAEDAAGLELSLQGMMHLLIQSSTHHEELCTLSRSIFPEEVNVPIDMLPFNLGN